MSISDVLTGSEIPFATLSEDGRVISLAPTETSHVGTTTVNVVLEDDDSVNYGGVKSAEYQFRVRVLDLPEDVETNEEFLEVKISDVS